MNQFDAGKIMGLLAGPTMDACVRQVADERGYANDVEMNYMLGRSGFPMNGREIVEAVQRLAGDLGVPVDVSDLSVALMDAERVREAAAEAKRKEREQVAAEREERKERVAKLNHALLAPVSEYMEEAEWGWNAMRRFSPNLDGVSSFSDLGPGSKFRYAVFASGVFGTPYDGPRPDFQKVI